MQVAVLLEALHVHHIAWMLSLVGCSSGSKRNARLGQHVRTCQAQLNLSMLVFLLLGSSFDVPEAAWAGQPVKPWCNGMLSA